MARRRRSRLEAFAILSLAVIESTAISAALLRRELSLSFSTASQQGAELPTNGSFVFDGSTSDIARQLYLRHAAGDSIDPVIPNAIPSSVTDRLSPLNVSYTDLPGLLQRALLWDSGFAITPENNAVQIYTLGGRPMANLAVSKVEYDTAGCTAFNCSQPDNSTYYANQFCTGTQMLTAAKCLMNDFDSDWSSHLAMWSDGGDPDMVPAIRAMTHGWLDASTNKSYVVYAVHTMSSNSEPAYGACNPGGYGSLVVPCYPMSNTSADVVAVMGEPVASPWITTWIKQYQPPPETTVSSEASEGGKSFNLWLLVPIIVLSLAVAVAIMIVVFRKRQHLTNAWQRQLSVNPIESAEPGQQKAKPVGQRPRNRTSLRRTEQETIGEFNRTLRLPGPDDEGLSPVEDNSPLENEMPSPIHATVLETPAIAIDPPRRTSTRSGRSKTLPATRHPAKTVRSNTIPSSQRMIPSGARDSLSGNRDSLPAVRGPLPGVRESMSEYRRSSIDRGESMPGMRESMTDALGAITDIRETFCRYSAVDNVQFTLVTDSNLMGKRIAWERIEFVRQLSQGAFGEVWACRYAGKKVAVKRLLQSKKPSFVETQKFTDEIQLTASLSHPNIVRFIGVAWTNLETLAMVEEYLPRGDLQNYLKRKGDLMSWPGDKIYMALGIAKGVEYLHSRDVIHRDIKARNVLLTKRLQPKLIDFGASRLLAPSEMSAGVGTPYWTAPEVLESTAYTEKADIYSFGVLLSELDTCEPPYHNELGANGQQMKPFHVLKQVVDGSLTPSFTVGCPKRIRRVANACFQRDPQLRPSASELVKMLEG